MNRKTRSVALMALICSPVIFADNLFKSLTGDKIIGSVDTPLTSVQVDPERDPLLRWPVDNYVLMGVLLSEGNSIAILRTPMPHAQTYLVRKHDLLGDRDGVIMSIEAAKLIVVIQIDGEVPEEKTLQVRNKGVKTKNET